jgi:phosphonoacetaldehyde hydrolase
MTALKAVVFDWAGTIVDFGSRAPMGAFVEVFKSFGVDISIEEARGPMGLPKWQHIEALMRAPRIAEAWRKAQGHEPGKADIDRVYEVFTPLNAKVVTNFGTLVPGARDTVEALRRRGLKIGSTTGYTREIMAPLLPVAAKQGYSPDNLVCAGDLAEGRPSPLMMYRTFADLGVYPPSAVVKVDDTEPGIAEGKAAGTWTVGVAVSGNALGLSEEEWRATEKAEQHRLAEAARRSLEATGADYVVASVADLLPIIDAIETRIAAGEAPRLAA